MQEAKQRKPWYSYKFKSRTGSGPPPAKIQKIQTPNASTDMAEKNNDVDMPDADYQQDDAAIGAGASSGGIGGGNKKHFWNARHCPNASRT